MTTEISTKELTLIGRIAGRVIALTKERQRRSGDYSHCGPGLPPSLDLSRAVAIFHTRNRPLRLAELADAPEDDILHDVWGIYTYMDRATAMLPDAQEFWPRYVAEPEGAGAP